MNKRHRTRKRRRVRPFLTPENEAALVRWRHAAALLTDAPLGAVRESKGVHFLRIRTGWELCSPDGKPCAITFIKTP